MDFGFEYTLTEIFKLGMDRILDPFLTAEGPIRINLGHGTKKMPAGVRSIGLPEWDAEKDRIPFDDGAVDEIWALHFMEHIQNVVPLLRECERVLKHHGRLNIVVPYAASHCAIQDITHKHRFNEDTWKTLFNNPYYDPELRTIDISAWRLEIQSNFICGIKGENLALFTQLIKE